MPDPNAKRKSLEDLLADPEARAFVRTQATPKRANTSTRQHAGMSARQEEKISVSVKVPKRIGYALWRAMHERTAERKRKTLAEGEPCEKQDIVAQAIEQWLQAKGYLQ